jgi:hypothetical protein
MCNSAQKSRFDWRYSRVGLENNVLGFKVMILNRAALAAVSILSVLLTPAHAAADGSKLKVLHEFQRTGRGRADFPTAHE